MTIKRFNIFLTAAAVIFFFSCTSPESEDYYNTGTVKYISLEGGFFGINGDDNNHYDPINLPKEFQVEGKRIMFKYKVRSDLASFHMWGILIEIIEIKELK